MSNEKDQFSADRWREPPAYKSIGRTDFTEEEKKRKRDDFAEYLKSQGYKVEEPAQDK